jgi:thioesterase domain-containing protein
MRNFATAAVMGLVFAVAACSQAEQADTAQDTRAAAAKVGQETREAVNSPELKEVGQELKEAGRDVAEVAKGAVSGAKEAASEVRAESANEVHDTHDTGTATTTTTTTTTRR